MKKGLKKVFAVFTREGSDAGKWWKANPKNVFKADYYVDVAVNDGQRIKHVYKFADDMYHQGKIKNPKTGKKSMFYAYSLKEVDLTLDRIAAKIATMSVPEMKRHWNPTWYFDYDADNDKFCNFGVLNW